MIEYSEEDYNMEYQTKLGKKFRALPADPEGTPISEYRKEELEKIEAFLESDKAVCLVPGISATGKTFFFKALAKEKGFAFVDIQGLGGGAIEHRTEEVESAKECTIFDEGLCLDSESAKSDFDKLFELAQQKGHKIFLLGGGAGHTTEDQAPLLREHIPSGNKMEEILFHLKQLNETQTTEIMRGRIKEDKGFWGRVGNVIDDQEKGKKMANLFHPYVRFPRSVSMFPVDEKEYDLGGGGRELLVLEDDIWSNEEMSEEKKLEYVEKIKLIRKNWAQVGKIIRESAG